MYIYSTELLIPNLALNKLLEVPVEGKDSSDMVYLAYHDSHVNRDSVMDESLHSKSST